jgi:hypothetical protein
MVTFKGPECHDNRLLMNHYQRASHACEWPALRSVASSTGHTVGGMCMQTADVAMTISRRPPCRCVQTREEPEC